ncbi:acyltransferase [Clostridium sp.]|uniref:acyltransferase family protein n=1 Tax=Clostridium sp. TaxID=1506 RepID=UPI003216BBAE
MKGKIRYFDGLRGLAALVVVIQHYILAFYPAIFSRSDELRHTSYAFETTLASTPFNIFFNGNFAVCIFFVLSGYVLTNKFFITKNAEYITAGACKRYIRLMVPVLVIISTAYIFMKLSLFNNIEVAKITLSSNWLATTYDFEPNLMSMLKQATFGVFVGSDFSYNTSLWTMGYEFLGSFLVFSLAIIFGKLKKRYIFYTITAIYFVKTYYLAFILGMILSDCYNSNYEIIRKLKGRCASIICLILGLFMGSYPLVPTDNTIYKYMNIESFEPGVFYRTLGAVLLMIAIMNSKLLIEFFSSKVMIFLGKISFSMYLIHLIIICSFSGALFTSTLPYLSYNKAFILTFVVSMILIFIISYYYCKYVDDTAVKLSSYVYKKIFLNDSSADVINNKDINRKIDVKQNIKVIE